jgi:hypothetical protein
VGWLQPRERRGNPPAAELHAKLFAKFGRYRDRLAPDYQLRVAELSAGMLDALAEVSAGSKFWKPS